MSHNPPPVSREVGNSTVIINAIQSGSRQGRSRAEVEATVVRLKFGEVSRADPERMREIAGFVAQYDNYLKKVGPVAQQMARSKGMGV